MRAYLVHAVSLVDGELSDAWLFRLVTHTDARIDPRKLLLDAFKIWCEEGDGMDYVRANGTNWGDATMIPQDYLSRAGIYAFLHAEHTGRRDAERAHYVVSQTYNNKLLVDHDEELFPQNLWPDRSEE